jgi:hypothetical protein
VSEDAEEVDGAKSALPAYVAVKGSVSAGSKDEVNVATPELFGVAVPTVVAPKTKVTVPMGEPVGTGVIVAVIVTVSPKFAGFGDTAKVTVVASIDTVNATDEDVEVPSKLFPEYTAVRTNVPTGRVARFNVAEPEAPTELDPIIVVPLKKFTVPRDEPIGTGLIVAVSVTVWPKFDELGFTANAVVVGLKRERL